MKLSRNESTLLRQNELNNEVEQACLLDLNLNPFNPG